MAKSVKKTQKKAVSPINGQTLGPGPGRPKGSRNKLTIFEEAFFEAWDENEGKKGLKDHIKSRKREFYQMVLSIVEDRLKKQTPSDINLGGDGSLIIKVVQVGNDNGDLGDNGNNG